MKIFLFIFLLFSFILPSYSSVVEILEFDSTEQELEYRELIQMLRCPQCQNSSIADSNATIAMDMRNKVLVLLKQGKNEDEIMHYMVERYGNFVTYSPPITPITLLLWLTPIGFIGISCRRLWKWQSNKQAVTCDKNMTDFDQQERLNRILQNKEQK